MTSLILVLAVIAISLLVIRVAAVMLALTGMSRESARFQARSAFTGVGFTTSEAESVTTHPLRRRVVMTLMLFGSAGVVTAVASLIVSFGGASGGERVSRGVLLLAGVLVLLIVSRSKQVDRLIARLTARALHARGLDARDYAGLLQLDSGYRVGELEVEPGDWVAGRTLADLRLRDEGVIVLGIKRPGDSYLGVPGKATEIEPGDTLVIYGHEERLIELDRRGRGAGGDRAHSAAAQRSTRATPAASA
ncbi:MAG: TrkA C-terminal domain-containing protein [Gaiellaceae bacterium]